MSVRNAVARQVDKNKDALVEFVRKLVRIPTQDPPGENYPKICSALTEKLSGLGMDVETVVAPEKVLREKRAGNIVWESMPWSGERTNVIAKLKGAERKKTLLYNGHIDTVPVGAGWTRDPFKGEIIGGRMYGRGTCDMKGSCAALVYAFTALREAGVKLKGDVALTFTSDEERGGYTSLCYLVDAGYIKGDAMVGADGNIENIHVASNGRIIFKVVTHGKAVHSSVAFRGINAIEGMVPVLEELFRLKKAVEVRETDIPVNPRQGIKHLTPLLTPTMIDAGIVPNMVPSECTLMIDRRVVPTEDPDKAVKEVEDRIARVKLPAGKCTVETSVVYDPWQVDPKSPIVQTSMKVLNELTGNKVTYAGIQGSTDIGWVVNKGKIPSVFFGAGRMEGMAHGADEYVEIADLVTATKAFAFIAMDYLGY